MDKNKLASLKKIENFIDLRQYEKALECFNSNISELLSIPKLREVYNTITRIPKTYFRKAEHKLLYGWICLEIGNANGLKWVLAELNFSKMKSNRSKASYLALSSVSLGLKRPEKGLYLTQRALTYFEDGDTSLARANVYYNYAKQLEKCHLFCLAAQNYGFAAELFEVQNIDYYAISCYFREALNNCDAGKYNDAEKKCYYLLANERRLSNVLWNVLKLPIAISYYYKDELDKSLKLLLEVKSIMRKVPIPRIHTLVYKYMLNVYLNQQKKNEINTLIEKIKKNKSYQQLPQLMQLVAAAEVEKEILFKEDVSKNVLKELGDILTGAKINAPFYVIECLFRLKLQGKINGLKIDYLTMYFNKARDIGNASNVQSMALFLSDIYYNKGDKDKSRYHLEIAYKVYKQTGSVINFVNRNISSISVLKEIDEEFYDFVLNNNNYISN